MWNQDLILWDFFMKLFQEKYLDHVEHKTTKKNLFLSAGLLITMLWGQLLFKSNISNNHNIIVPVYMIKLFNINFFINDKIIV